MRRWPGRKSALEIHPVQYLAGGSLRGSGEDVVVGKPDRAASLIAGTMVSQPTANERKWNERIDKTVQAKHRYLRFAGDWRRVEFTQQADAMSHDQAVQFGPALDKFGFIRKVGVWEGGLVVMRDEPESIVSCVWGT